MTRYVSTWVRRTLTLTGIVAILVAGGTGRATALGKAQACSPSTPGASLDFTLRGTLTGDR